MQLKGRRELSAFLQAFPKRLANGAVRAGLTAAAAPIRDQARALVPRKTGKLAKSIKTGSPKVNKDGTVTVSIRPDKKGNNHAYLAYFFEYGVSPHFIRAGDSGKSARLLTRQANRGGMREESGALIIGNQFVTGAVHHPGFSPKPFLRPALDMKADDAVNAFGKRVREYLAGKTGFTAPLLEVDDE